MALKFEIDSLDGVDDAIKPLYQEHGGKFRLAVEGIDPADELKGALQREREERKTAKQRAEELQRQLEAKELAELEGNRKFEELYKRSQENERKLSAELELIRKQAAEKAIGESAAKIAGQLTRDTGRAEILMEKAASYIQHGDGATKIIIDGVEATAEQLQKLLSEKYPFLADGLQSSGGNATGGARITAGKKFSDYTAAELSAIRRDNPTEYDRLRTQR